jgi:hypothetical protein
VLQLYIAIFGGLKIPQKKKKERKKERNKEEKTLH